MNNEELKQKLLDTNCFVDNEWLDKYVDIIINQRLDEHIMYKSAKHHILPRHYFIRNKLNIDNSNNNIVELYHSKHAEAHLYLSLCAVDKYYQSANASAMWFCIKRTTENTIISETEVEEFLTLVHQLEATGLLDYSFTEEHIKKLCDLRWCNDGINDFHYNVYDGIPEGYMEGRVKKDFYSKAARDRVWLNNGTEQVHVKPELIQEYLDSGYSHGMLDRGSNWKQNVTQALRANIVERSKNISKSKKEFFKNNPEFRNGGNWKPGQVPHNKGKIWITNGVENHYINKDDVIPDGYRKGCTQNKENKKDIK